MTRNTNNSVDWKSHCVHPRKGERRSCFQTLGLPLCSLWAARLKIPFLSPAERLPAQPALAGGFAFFLDPNRQLSWGAALSHQTHSHLSERCLKGGLRNKTRAGSTPGPAAARLIHARYCSQSLTPDCHPPWFPTRSHILCFTSLSSLAMCDKKKRSRNRWDYIHPQLPICWNSLHAFWTWSSVPCQNVLGTQMSPAQRCVPLFINVYLCVNKDYTLGLGPAGLWI